MLSKIIKRLCKTHRPKRYWYNGYSIDSNGFFSFTGVHRREVTKCWICGEVIRTDEYTVRHDLGLCIPHNISKRVTVNGDILWIKSIIELDMGVKNNTTESTQYLINELS